MVPDADKESLCLPSLRVCDSKDNVNNNKYDDGFDHTINKEAMVDGDKESLWIPSLLVLHSSKTKNNNNKNHNVSDQSKVTLLKPIPRTEEASPSQQWSFNFTKQQRKELSGIVRSLRRVKRMLLLKSVAKHEKPVDELRALFLQMTIYSAPQKDSGTFSSRASLCSSCCSTILSTANVSSLGDEMSNEE